jgi:hypothetical protein
MERGRCHALTVLVEHDGYICAERHADELSEIIQKVYKEGFGVEFSPVLTRKGLPE